MPNELEPIEGQWYETTKNRIFRVVSIDENSGMIELQHQDGDLNEIDQAEWSSLDLERVEEPSDWRGSMDPSTDEET
ncbi:MAG: hypothetical protein LJE56_10685 [Acidiferrobacterales bacterium]|jgi:hypothetical protein|nr:hypothetical protein [Acidiferrobacterales bacterium]